MDPSRKRAIRLTAALTAAVLLASALIYVSFTAGRDELTAGQLLERAHPGGSYILAGTVQPGSVRRDGAVLYFRVMDPKLPETVQVRYTGEVPDPFAAGRGVLLNVTEPANDPAGGSATFVGQANSLTTKCPSKYQVAEPSAKQSRVTRLESAVKDY
jgi:cytochrome c-type biogenesis protein CcmE